MLKNTLTPVFTRTRFSNAAFTSSTNGALGAEDRGAYQFVPAITGNPYESADYIFRWRQYCHLYEICWEARKIVRIPVEDALRKDWEIENVNEQMIQVLKRAEIKFQFRASIARAWMLERLLGGSIQFFGVQEDTDDVSRPFDPRLGRAPLQFINVIPISRISRANWDTNPMSAGYMRPHEFLINGHMMHVSRCILWDGEPLFDPYDFALTQFRANLAGFGPSKLAPIWDDIIKAVGTRQAAYQLIQTNNALIMAVSQLADISGTTPGRKKLAELKEIAKNLSLFRAAIIDKEKVDISQKAASFGSVPELLMTFLQVLSAASDIPATRFLGQAPGGLNATGESDLENYYNMIDAMQRQRLEPAIRKFYDVVGYQKWPDTWASVRDRMEIKFPPLWNINELEEAQKNQIELANIFQAWEQGLMPDEKAIEEINLKQIFSTDLDEKDIDVMKGMQDDAGLYGGDGAQETPFNRPTTAVGGISGAGAGGDKAPKENPSTSAAKTPAPKQPSLPKIGNTTDPTTYDPEQVMLGMKEEQEHNDLTNGDPVQIAQIVKAHLDEDPEYYSKLQKVMNKGEFKEEEHPRADDGKFGTKSGNKGKSAKDKKETQTARREKSTFKDPILRKVDEAINTPEILKRIRIPDVLYHVTSSKNTAEQIKKNGFSIDKKKTSQIGESDNRVYFSNDPYAIMDSFEFDDISDPQIIKVSTDALDLRLDPEFYQDFADDSDALVKHINAKLLQGKRQTDLYVYSVDPVHSTQIIKNAILQKVMNKDAFKEEEHPRADNGKFGTGPGSSKTEHDPPKKEKKPKQTDDAGEEQNISYVLSIQEDGVKAI